MSIEHRRLIVTDPGADDLGAIAYLSKLDASQLVLISTFGNVPEQ